MTGPILVAASDQLEYHFCLINRTATNVDVTGRVYLLQDSGKVDRNGDVVWSRKYVKDFTASYPAGTADADLVASTVSTEKGADSAAVAASLTVAAPGVAVPTNTACSL